MKGGFPDGALGRWRTLNEIAVVAHFLAGQDKARVVASKTLNSWHPNSQASAAILQAYP